MGGREQSERGRVVRRWEKAERERKEERSRKAGRGRGDGTEG